jgi:hypothetical protein
MVSDPGYYRWLQQKARRTALKYRVDERDLLQDFFLSALEGKTAKFEHVFFSSIRSEYQRGITGRTDAADFSVDDTLLDRVRDNRRSMPDHEFIEYICDLRTICSETEFKLVCMYIVGFDQGEIWKMSKDVSRRELAALWKRLGLRRGIV